LWTEVSHLFKYLELEENLSISRAAVNRFLKTLQATHKKKQAPAFEVEELFSFLDATPNEPEHLVIKLYTLFSYYGALRSSEADSLTFASVNVSTDGLLLTVIRKKTDKANIGEIKLIPKHENPRRCSITIFNLYKSLVVTNKKLWMKFDDRLKKFVNSPIGRNSLAKFASKIAAILGKTNPASYTGHSFRVTSATALADAGATATNLKRHGGWKSDAIAEGYIRNSKRVKLEIASMLSSDKPQENMEKIISNSIFQNCVFNNCNLSIKEK
jgi:integrase